MINFIFELFVSPLVFLSVSLSSFFLLFLSLSNSLVFHSHSHRQRHCHHHRHCLMFNLNLNLYFMRSLRFLLIQHVLCFFPWQWERGSDDERVVKVHEERNHRDELHLDLRPAPPYAFFFQVDLLHRCLQHYLRVDLQVFGFVDLEELKSISLRFVDLQKIKSTNFRNAPISQRLWRQILKIQFFEDTSSKHIFSV